MQNDRKFGWVETWFNTKLVPSLRLITFIRIIHTKIESIFVCVCVRERVCCVSVGLSLFWLKCFCRWNIIRFYITSCERCLNWNDMSANIQTPTKRIFFFFWRNKRNVFETTKFALQNNVYIYSPRSSTYAALKMGPIENYQHIYSVKATHIFRNVVFALRFWLWWLWCWWWMISEQDPNIERNEWISHHHYSFALTIFSEILESFSFERVPIYPHTKNTYIYAFYPKQYNEIYDYTR